MKIIGWTHDIQPKKVTKGDTLSFTVDDDMDISLAIFLGERDTAGTGADKDDHSVRLLCRVISHMHEENESLRTKVERYKDLDHIVAEQAKKLAELGEEMDL